MTTERTGTPRELSPGHRWTCQFCGYSRVTKFRKSDEEREAAYARAERALTAHVQSSVGGGHGPKNALPDGFAAEALAASIEPEKR